MSSKVGIDNAEGGVVEYKSHSHTALVTLGTELQVRLLHKHIQKRLGNRLNRRELGKGTETMKTRGTLTGKEAAGMRE